MKENWKLKRSRRFFVLMAGGLLALVLIVGGILSLTQHQTWRTDTCGPQAGAVVTTLHPGVAQPTGDRFYAGSDSYLYAMSGTPPKMLWCRHLVSSDGSSRGIRSLQQSGGQVYASMLDNSLVDVDGASGAIRWRQNEVIGSVNDFPPHPVPVIAGVVYGGYNRDIFALNTNDGSVRWRYTLPEGHTIWSTLTAAGGLVYFGAIDSLPDGGIAAHPHVRVYAVDASIGSLRWGVDWTNNKFIEGPILVEKGHVYVLEGYDLYALDAKTGRQLWRAGGPINDPLTYSQDLVYGASETGLKAFDTENGRVRWLASGYNGSPLLVQNNLLYAGRAFEPITAFDARTGKRLWQRLLALGAGDTMLSSVFVRNGALYIAAQDLPSGESRGRNIIHKLNAQTGQEEWYIILATEKPAGREFSLTF